MFSTIVVAMNNSPKPGCSFDTSIDALLAATPHADLPNATRLRLEATFNLSRAKSGLKRSVSRGDATHMDSRAHVTCENTYHG